MKQALNRALESYQHNERHQTLAETRYWCDQYKLLAKIAIEELAKQTCEMGEMCLQCPDAKPKQEQGEPVAIIHRNEYNEYRLEPHDSFDIKSIPFNVDVLLFKEKSNA